MYIVTIKNKDFETVIHGTPEKLRSGKVTKGINAIDSFTFSMLPDNAGFSLINEFTTLVTVYNTNRARYEFIGRVLYSDTSMSENGLITKDVTCESVLGYLCDSQQPYVDTQNWTVEGLLRHIIDNHNALVEDYKRIEVGTITATDNNDNLYVGIQRDNSWNTIKTKLIDSIGGELQYRVVDDVVYLDYLSQIGEEKETEIALSVNMKAITREVDPTAYVTRMIPLGCKLTKEVENTDEEGNVTTETVETEERLDITSVNNGLNYIDDDEAIAVYGIHVGYIEYDDVTDAQNLKSKGAAWMRENNKVQVKYSITALDLSLIGLAIDDFQLGNSYPIKNALLGIDDKARVIKESIDVCEEIKSSIEVGDNFKTLSDIRREQADALRAAYSNISNLESQYTNAINRVNSAASKVNSIVSSVVYYYLSTSNTTQTGGSWVTTPPAWVEGRYYWQKIVTTYTDETTTESSPVCITGGKGATGEKGETGATGADGASGKDGDDGVGVSSITTQFYLSTSNTTQTGGSWVATMPTWSSGKYLWTRSVITYTDGTTEYTAPICDSSWEAVNEIEIGGRNWLLKTATPKIVTGTNIENECVFLYRINADVAELAGRTVTLSFKYAVSDYAGGTFRMQTANNVWIGLTGTITPTADGTYSYQRTTTLTDATGYLYVQIRLDNFVGSVEISKMKLEVGNKASDWTPANEDVDAEIEALNTVTETLNTDIQQTKTDITAVANRTTTVENKFANYSTTEEMQAAIELSADGINSTVSATYATKSEAKKQEWHSASGESGVSGYVAFARLTISKTYMNRPIRFGLRNRGTVSSDVDIMFTNVNGYDPSVHFIRENGSIGVWIAKIDTSTWYVIAKKSESYDTIYVTDYVNNNSGIAVSWTNVHYSALPTENITAATKLIGSAASSTIATKTEITQLADSITLTATGALGNSASIKLSVNGNEVEQTLDLSDVRTAFANDSTSVTISGGTITFNSGTIIINSTNFSVTSTGVITATSGTIGALSLSATGIYSHNASESATYAGWYKPSSVSSSAICFFAGATNSAGTNARYSVTYGGEMTSTNEARTQSAKFTSGGVYWYYEDACTALLSAFSIGRYDSTTGTNERIGSGLNLALVEDYSRFIITHGTTTQLMFDFSGTYDEVFRCLTTARFTKSTYIDALYCNTIAPEDDAFYVGGTSYATYLRGSTLYVGDASYPTYIRGSAITISNAATFSGAATFAVNPRLKNGIFLIGYEPDGTARRICGNATDGYTYFGMTLVPTIVNGSTVYINNTSNATYIRGSSITVNGATSFDSAVYLANSNHLYVYDTDDTAHRALGMNKSGHLLVGNYSDAPTFVYGSTLYLGYSNNVTYLRGSSVYLKDSNTVVTSDRNAKNSIEALPDEYETFFDELEAVRFKYNSGRSGRYHVGFIAQDVLTALTRAGLDSTDFAGYVAVEGTDELGLSYDEFIALLAAKIKKLERRIAVLENI